MLKRTIWVLVTGIIILAVLLTSCKSATVQPTGGTTVVGTATQQPGTTTTTTSTTTASTTGPTLVKSSTGKMVEPPQYGGTMYIAWTTTSPTETWDPVVSTTAGYTSVLVYETLAQGDWTKGPQGTNEFGFDTTYTPDLYLTGDLAQSWERPDSRTLIEHLRPGVHWQNKPPMNGREVTADDILYSFARGANDPRNVWYVNPSTPDAQRLHIVALDKYTVQFTQPDPDGRLIHEMSEWEYIEPKEAIQQYGNLDNWKNAVGTGPFMVQDCVVDSSALFVRNPNYWMPDPFFPQNQLPYIDKLQALVITDQSTRIAAMRTHKIDIYNYFPWDNVASIKQTNPEINVRRTPGDNGAEIFLRTDIAPFNDKRVRQALQYAVDEPGIMKDYYKGDAVILGWPIQPFFTNEYTPLDQLPQNLQEMFQYKPDIAKKMLADAGYPNGIKTEVDVVATAQSYIDLLSVVKQNFAAAGVDMTIKPTEVSTFISILYHETYPSMIFTYWGNPGIDDAFGWANGGWVGKDRSNSIYDFSKVIDPVAEAAYIKLMNTTDFMTGEKLREGRKCPGN